MRHNKDLIEIAKFLDAVHASFAELCDNQSNIVKSYNGLAELWSDSVYSATGEALTETAITTEKAYLAFTEVCGVLRRQHEILCAYQEIDEVRHYEELTFVKNIQWGSQAMNNGRMRVAIADIEAFERALDVYLDILEEETRKIRDQYRGVGESWRDDQYEAFGEHVEEFAHRVNEEIKYLDDLAVLLAEKRRFLEEEESLS